ncbi:hypothetical protein SHAM105786_02500 [Shewanella amazonensis]
MQSSVSIIRHQWLLYAALLTLGLALCLPSGERPWVMLPLCAIGVNFLRATPVTHLGMASLFAIWLLCFANAM